ncbi:hypothetical protein ACTA71_005723 [Dictyostelium dimigraforme]
MRLLLAILFVLALVAPSFSTAIWSNCGTAADKLQIQNVTLTPEIPVKGDSLTITASGTLSEEVTSGTASITVKFGFITLIDKKYSICSSQDPIPCPIAAGLYEKTITETIPDSAPSGTYTANIVITDQNDSEITCIDVDLHL